MRRGLVTGLTAIALAGCGGGGGLEGTLEWDGDPQRTGNAVRGQIRNTTSNTVRVDGSQMRLLDADGRKVDGKIAVGAGELGAGKTTSLRARWRKGAPTRLDYGAGTLQLPAR